MIAVDTSALIAILLDEPEAARCMAVLEAEPDILISAGTLFETMIVAAARKSAARMESFLDGFGFEVVPVTAESARRAGRIYARWGKGYHAAALNFGDCFAYDVANQAGVRLLFVGNDFALTDIESVL